MGQFDSDLLGPSEVETWDTLMGASDPNWNQPAPASYVEPAAGPMYAPAPELSYQAPYEASAQNYGTDASAYAPEMAYGGPAEPAYVDPFMAGDATQQYQDPFMQQAYAPAEQMAPTYDSLNLDPSVGQQFGWDQGYTPPASEPQSFFDNPQFAQSNAQFDATTNPENRNGPGILGGAANLANIYGADIPGWSNLARETIIPGLAGSLNAQNPLTWFDNPVGNLIEKGNRLGAESVVPVSLGDVALTALPGIGLFDNAGQTALRGYGQNLDTFRKAAGQIDELPLEAARGALNKSYENPAFAPDVAELVTRRGGGSVTGSGAVEDFLDMARNAGTTRAEAKNAVQHAFDRYGDGEVIATAKEYFGIEATTRGEAIDRMFQEAWPVTRRQAPSAAEDAAGLAARASGEVADEAPYILRPTTGPGPGPDQGTLLPEPGLRSNYTPNFVGKEDLLRTVKFTEGDTTLSVWRGVDGWDMKIAREGAGAPQGRSVGSDFSSLSRIGKVIQDLQEMNPDASFYAKPGDARRSRVFQRLGFVPREGSETGELVLNKFRGTAAHAANAPTSGMAQIDDDVAAAIARGASAGKAATVADELGAVAEGPGEQALTAALKRAEKMPLDSETLLGVSELSDESKGIVAEYIRNTKALTAGQTQDVSRLRSVATKITGNIDNRVASEYARQEDSLYREIINSEARIVDEINKAAGKVVTKGMDEADIAEMEALKLAHIESIYRKATEATQVLRQSLKESLDFKGQQILNDALKSYDAERIKAAQSFFKKLADAQQPLKEMVLGGDISTIFQQGLRGARVGGTSAITGGLGRTANLVAKSLGGEGDMFGIYMKNGLTPVQQMRADGVRMGAEAVDLTRNRLPTTEEKGILQKIKPAWNAYQKWNDQQFKAVDKFKQLVYEGRLMQEKALGNDITDPKVRRAIADFVNTAGSTSSRATAPMRGEVDRAFFLTSAMTRAQINEGLQVAKAFTSRTEAANFLNQALSTASVIGLAWQVQKNFGPDISLEDFVKQSFDPSNPKMFGRLLTEAGGKTYVNSFLPQSSLAATFVKSYADIADGDMKKLAEDWAKFGFGRQNIGLTTAENLGGFGYGKDGQFFWGDMPNDQRAKEAVPMPLTVKAAALDSGVNYQNIAEGAVSGDAGSIMDEIKKIDPYLVGAQATGELAYAESDTAERTREDPQLQQAIDTYWAAYDVAYQAQKAKGASGAYAPLLSETSSWDDLSKTIDQIVEVAVQLNPRLDRDAQRTKILKELGITEQAQKVRANSVTQDPRVIEYLQEKKQDVPKYLWEAYDKAGGKK